MSEQTVNEQLAEIITSITTLKRNLEGFITAAVGSDMETLSGVVENLSTIVTAVGDAQAAQASAESARDASVDAKEAAETAQGVAESAALDAGAAAGGSAVAQSFAETAQGAAETAAGDALIAAGAAQTAQGLAETAQGLAETAQGGAETAQGLAESAKDDAETAKGLAETAQSAAESAKDDAETAKGLAETAQGLAETAQGAAETAQGLAETAQGLAETAQGAAETAKDDAESAALAAMVAKIEWLGAWSSETAYIERQAVAYSGTSYICTADHTNQQPPNASYWDVLAARGNDGEMAGPETSTDEALARFNGTGGSSLQNSTATLDDNGNLTIPANAGVRLIAGTAPTTAAGAIAIYAKVVGGQPELFFREESSGDEVQITSAGSVLLSVSSITSDMPFGAGWGWNYEGEPLLVMTYGAALLVRDITIEGLEAHLGTAATGAALIFDILKNGTTIFSSKPQFAAGSTTLTAGTLSVTTANAGDRITFAVTQKGSSNAGEKLLATVKARLR